jgi:hypothetical protein
MPALGLATDSEEADVPDISYRSRKAMNTNRERLLQAAEEFCAAFAAKVDASTILTHFSTMKAISVYEHGDCALAPFLGRSFEGVEGVKKYFETIGSLLAYDNLRFSDYVIDPEVRKVMVKGQRKFIWLGTKETWDETFAYVLDFDEEANVVRYQIWADSGAAYLARIGKLREVQMVCARCFHVSGRRIHGGCLGRRLLRC